VAEWVRHPPSPEQKISINPGQHTECTWQIPLAKMYPGIYRADVLLADGVAWRQYFKISD
jgi:hypothetical protein